MCYFPSPSSPCIRALQHAVCPLATTSPTEMSSGAIRNGTACCRVEGEANLTPVWCVTHQSSFPFAFTLTTSSSLRTSLSFGISSARLRLEIRLPCNCQSSSLAFSWTCAQVRRRWRECPFVRVSHQSNGGGKVDLLYLCVGHHEFHGILESHPLFPDPGKGHSAASKFVVEDD